MAKGMNVIAVAAAGFIAGMLLAPKSGKETRQDIMDKASGAKRAAGEKADHMKDVMNDVGSEVSGFAHNAKRRMGRMIDEEKDMLDEAKTRANRVSGKVSDAAEQEMQSDADKKRLG